ncbi:hypothetical protein QAO71_17455 (plasmid) [Halopseudomonas sp. SMJS2]|uniref:hypothetical protein n=1 Tax=Halopseudomonas sp. SMJS2 TaxID=3041098 RepID=UPI0024531A37|nr:hypothetical protein [Halopseudomonas sp. SMJS2]WGK63556.1 hypothetical protein QAO71_17455 [Halopseudomonas sp. SMJS2]
MRNENTEAPETEEKVVFWGPQGSFSPTVFPPPQREAAALALFQSFLCNSEAEAIGLSNVITLWELIPKYTADNLNYLDEIPNDYQKEFQIYGGKFKLTLFPGTYYPNKKSNKPKRRFPGVREQVVEQALIYLACQQAQAEEVNGEISYFITFSIREMAMVLKAMGRTHSHGQIREALEVLSSSVMTIKKEGTSETSNRNPIVPSFTRTTSHDETISGKDNWKIQLHPLVTHAIRNVGYRQFQYDMGADLAPFASYLQRQMHFLAPNISSEHPLTIRLTELRNRTPGLDHKTIRASINALKRELGKMEDAGFVNQFDIAPIFPKRSAPGRPAPVDAEVTIYPGSDLVRHVKAGSKRLTVSERALGLLRSQRDSRQKTLPLF